MDASTRDRRWLDQHLRQLQALSHECCAQSAAWSQLAQARKVNRKRGAWRRPPLAGSVSRLERFLRSEYSRLERQIVAALAGASLEKARVAEEMPEFDEQEPVDRKRLAVILILLGLWRSKQLRVLEDAAGEAFEIGREQVLKRAGYAEAPKMPATAALLPQLITRFEKDSQRFHSDLLDGSPRSRGVREIAEDGGTLAEATVDLRFLFDSESFRLGMWSEAVIWASWMSGFRAGAVDATAKAIASGEKPLQFEWRGPADSITCDPCMGMFKEPVVANSLEELPAPWDVCLFRFGCRHWWGVT